MVVGGRAWVVVGGGVVGGVVVAAGAVDVGRGGNVVVGHGGVPGVPQGGGGTSCLADADAGPTTHVINTAVAIIPAAPAGQRRLGCRAGIGWNVDVVMTRLLVRDRRVSSDRRE